MPFPHHCKGGCWQLAHEGVGSPRVSLGHFLFCFGVSLLVTWRMRLLRSSWAALVSLTCGSCVGPVPHVNNPTALCSTAEEPLPTYCRGTTSHLAVRVSPTPYLFFAKRFL
ncbi:hypothetical protein SEVIR_4G041301v4 [Setaria viridis]